jgi:hypothetical protein
MVVKFHERICCLLNKGPVVMVPRGQPTQVPIKPPGWDALLMREESFVELAEDRDNVSEWGNMSTHRLLFQ